MDSGKYIWMDGEMVDWDSATVHVLSHALHYGTGVFEGIRVDVGVAVGNEKLVAVATACSVNFFARRSSLIFAPIL